ncbi:MAG: acyltransferase [Deltaproteobacteria bacterium]|nr:acyltransferase [Deltaproteobacteria bacterium]
MLNFLPFKILGLLSAVLLGLNVLFWVSLLFFFSLLKFLLPWPPWRRGFDRILPWIAENWISCNSGWMRLTQKTRWDVQGLDDLNYHQWYLVIGNHQSWADIFVMQHLLNRRIRLLKFFLKRELIWVPVIGLAWWALDFPFLRRHTAEYLKKHPRQKGKDLITTRKACEKFARHPTSLMNFLEGTRFSGAKHQRQQSPYEYLLRPKSGGLAQALNVLGEKFHFLLNITIVYPDGIPTFWKFLCGKVNRVGVHFQTIEIPWNFRQGDYAGDQVFRETFHQWIHQLWREKDLRIQLLLDEAGCIKNSDCLPLCLPGS